MTVLHLLLCSSFLAPSLAFAQGGLPACLVTDTSGDTVWLMSDVDSDGTFNGVGEATVFYDDTSGSIALTNNAGMIRSADGAVWISDTTEDFILRLFDANADGDALDSGEATVWFDGTSGNPSGVEVTSGRGMWRDDDGVLWVASANSGGGGVDAIIRLEDVNMDGDANDVGEQIEFYTPSIGGSVGDSIPVAVARGADGALYYVETGATGVVDKGVYRLEDLDGSGTIDQANEVALFFSPSGTSSVAFHWDLSIDDTGRFYMNDTGNDVVWRFSDANGDGVIDVMTEAEVVYMAMGSSLIWETSPYSDGSLFVAEDQNPDRLLRLEDLDGDGKFLDPTEVQEVYSESVAAVNFGSPKRVIPFTMLSLPIGVVECTPEVPNSTGQSGSIQAFGSASIALNNVQLEAVQLPLNSFGFFIVSTDAGLVMEPGGSSGNLCLSGAIGRYVGSDIFFTGTTGTSSLAVEAGAIAQPTGPVAVAAGDTWRFQAWYRDADPMPTSNFTDAVAVTFSN